jgi:hypothetical protein
MKKILGLALVATLLMSASAFAVGRLTIAPNATFAAGAPATTDNNNTCDIGVTPAATLLLPYFEVETSTRANTTLFTITNTSRFPQIAHVTLWTDWSAPVLDFNIFLTGYDVQGINLYDVIVSGIIAPPSGTSVTSAIGTAQSTVTGATPASNTSNPNFASVGSCTGLPGTLPSSVAAAVLQVLTTGSSSAYCAGTQIGGNHGTRAIGYVTVDVVSTCNILLPNDPSYYGTTGLLYDNVLIGDYQQLGPSPAGSSGTGFDAGGDVMVHIRAIPEGGPAGLPAVGATNFAFTFYNRYNPSNNDRRQPLPSTFAARYVQGGASGLATDYKIWREGVTGSTLVSTCDEFVNNSSLVVTGMVRFDEHENSMGFGAGSICSPLCGPGGIPPLPETSRNSTSGGNFPALAGADVGGWMYLNLSNGGLSTVSGATNELTASRAGFGGIAPTFFRTTSQNWVEISMFGNFNTARLSVDFAAAWLGNGCTPAPIAGAIVSPAHLQPSGNLVCPVLAGAPCQVPVPNP